MTGRRGRGPMTRPGRRVTPSAMRMSAAMPATAPATTPTAVLEATPRCPGEHAPPLARRARGASRRPASGECPRSSRTGRDRAARAVHVRRLDPRLRPLQRARPRPGPAARSQRRRAVPGVQGSRPAVAWPGAARAPGGRRCDGRRPRTAGRRPREAAGRAGHRVAHDRRQRPAARPGPRQRRRHAALRGDARPLPAGLADTPGPAR